MADSRYVKGLDGALDFFRALPKELSGAGGLAVRASLRAGGQVIQKRIQENIGRIIAIPNIDGRSVSTGLLIANVVVSRGRMPPGLKGERYIVRIRNKSYADGKATTAQVARLLEYGWSDFAAQMPIHKAFDQSKDEVLTSIVYTINRRIELIRRRFNRR